MDGVRVRVVFLPGGGAGEGVGNLGRLHGSGGIGVAGSRVATFDDLAWDPGDRGRSGGVAPLFSSSRILYSNPSGGS